jgi:hypothetical protein
MSVLGLSGPPPDPPAVVSAQDKSDRKVIFTVVVLLIVFFLFIVSGAAFYWFHYIQKYGNIDRSGETLSFDYDPHQNISTTYSNPKYGVSLTLPGNWSRIGVASHAFVGLADAPPRTSPRFLVVLEPAFTGVPLSVDAEANSLAGRYAKLARGTLEKIERTSINGRDARVLSFSGDAANRTVRMAVFDRGPIAYILIIYGPTDATARWQYLDSMLPQSIKLD